MRVDLVMGKKTELPTISIVNCYGVVTDYNRDGWVCQDGKGQKMNCTNFVQIRTPNQQDPFS